MEQWDPHSEQVSKQRLDFEKAKALLNIVALREQCMRLTPITEFTTLIAEEYYEIIKELMSAILSCDGWKTTSHEQLIVYRGVMINPEYLKRSEKDIRAIIHKLKGTLNKRITKQT